MTGRISRTAGSFYMQLRFVSGRNFPPGRTKDQHDGSLFPSLRLPQQSAHDMPAGVTQDEMKVLGKFDCYPVKALSRSRSLAFSLSPRPFVLSRLSYISRSRAVLDISHTRLPSFPIRARNLQPCHPASYFAVIGGYLCLREC